MSYNTPVRFLQGGSVLEVGPSGTVSVLAGGSFVNAGANSLTGVNTIASGGTLAVASGGSIQIASGGILQSAGPLNVGGTLGKFAFGTVGLTSAVGTIGVPGFTRVLAATGNVILGEAAGAGSTTSVQIDLSLSGSGSVIFHTSIGTLPAAVNGTVVWMAWGT